MIDNSDVKEFFIKSIFDKRGDASISSCMILLRSNVSILNEL